MKDAATVHLGDLFRARKEPGSAGLPVLSVTMNNGLVPRDTLERKTNGRLAPEEHLLIRKGDIAYNMMRMWQGASGLAEKDGIVSPAYVVVTPKDPIDPLFAAYWFKSARMIHLFRAYSYGITGDRLRLYYKDFARVPVTVPVRSKQEETGRILATMDHAIDLVSTLISRKQRVKNDLAQNLLTGQRRLSEFTQPWGTTHLGNLATVMFSSVDKKSRVGEASVRICNYTDVYYNDRITPDLELMCATASDLEIAKYSLKQCDVIITKDSETPEDIAKPAVVTQDMPGVICGYHLAILRPKNVDGNYLAQLLRLPGTRHQIYRIANGVTRFGLSQKSLQSLELSIPEYEEQERIAKVLRTTDREIDLLNRKLATYRKLKKGLMQEFLGQPVSESTKDSDGTSA